MLLTDAQPCRITRGPVSKHRSAKGRLVRKSLSSRFVVVVVVVVVVAAVAAVVVVVVVAAVGGGGEENNGSIHH